MAASATSAPQEELEGKSIPASRRPDGTLRKEIKIRPGYKPPEDVQVYKNKTAEEWKNRADGGVPGAEALESSNEADSASGKNAKRREARKRAAAAAANSTSTAPANADAIANTNVEATTSQSVEPQSSETTDVKEAKRLAKKLRQAKELSQKKDQGAALLPEQFAKVIKINELVRQLDALGFDADGEPKAG